jgi:peptide-methionine (R)-S-oxide reductase
MTQENGTESRFRNEFWRHKEPGLYVDVVSGEPLFASVDKYDSRSGRPSFTAPVEPGNVVENSDTSYGMIRTEVRLKQCHLDAMPDQAPDSGDPP